MCVHYGGGKEGEGNLCKGRAIQELCSFFFISEVARRGLSKVVKPICSEEGGKEKRLVARRKEHKGKIVRWEC